MLREPADTVRGLGGDWYDVLSLPNDRTYLAVGDVVGHGLPAVKDMAQLRFAARALVHRGQSPAEVLTDLNVFTDHVLRSQFVTVVLAVVDHSAGTLTCSCVGHPPGISNAERLIADWPAEALLDCVAVADKLSPPPRSDDICVLVVRFD